LLFGALPMNYGFAIDNNRCIGCHACSTACKSENEVPLGVSRTWVKNVEHGAYPDVTRTFQVTRCNHCENPPCVRICPVTAMYQRDDGIVEFDKDACIGCKACMQACPYDAIHIDPESKTAAKCHFCSHRIDVGLEPACTVVCPTHAIISGDLDDPMSEISRMVSNARVTVRRPEQGTAPKVLYINADGIALHPSVFAQKPKQMMYTDHVSEQGHERIAAPAQRVTQTDRGTSIRRPGTQGVPSGSPVRSGGGTLAEQMVQLAYNAQHQVPWHWQVPAYLVTKGIGTGIFLFLIAGWLLGVFDFDTMAMVSGGAASIVMILATTALLVMDLERPERFLSILLRPQWKSWLTRGAFLLIGFSSVSGLWWAAELGAQQGWFELSAGVRPAAMWLTLPLAFGAAIYTAFLFAQAEGRDLWQSPLLPVHLIVQALMMGSGTMLLLGALGLSSESITNAAGHTFAAMLVLDALVILTGEFGIPHASEVAARAAHEITHGKYKRMFWLGAMLVGHLIPLGLALGLHGNAGAGAGAFILAAIGLYAYEHAFVMAPQEIPNS
jgi:Fe-S-cluster-containing dehydrogenase component/formate-dependent nitrite reductase membrane component NrfD